MIPSTRPIIIVDTASMQDDEKFQSIVLRPILKQQNDLILEIFSHHAEINKIILVQVTNAQLFERIDNCVKKDLILRSLLIGIIIGCFTIEELKFYQNQKAELNKRIVAMLIQRIYSQLLVKI